MSEPYAFLIQGPRRQAKLRLQGSFFVVGRAEPFPVFQDDPTISRDHLVVVATPEGVRVKDLGAKNGVAVNGRRLERYAEAPLAPGDLLVVGNTRLRLLDERESEGVAVTVDRDGRAEASGAAPEEGAATSAPDAAPTPEEVAALERTHAPDEEETQELDGLPPAEAAEAAETTAELERPEDVDGASPATREGSEERDGAEAGAEPDGDGDPPDDPAPDRGDEEPARGGPDDEASGASPEEGGAGARSGAVDDAELEPSAPAEEEAPERSEPPLLE